MMVQKSENTECWIRSVVILDSILIQIELD